MKLENYINLFDFKRKPISTINRQNLHKLYPYYGAQGIVDFVGDYIFEGEYILLAEDGNNLSTKSKPLATWASGKFWVNNHAHVFQTKPTLNQRYLFYWINHNNLDGYITGSAQPKLNQENLLSIEINPPSIERQQHIVDTIGSIDDLIENYQMKVDKICEILSKSLLLYPRKTEISKYNPTIIKSGITPFSCIKEYLDTSSVDEINNIFKSEVITYKKRPSRANMQPIKNSVWFAKMKGSHKKLIITAEDFDLLNKSILSTGFQGILATEELPLSLLTAFVISKEFNVQRDLNSIGTTMAGINNETFAKILVPYLTAEEIKDYDKKYRYFIVLLSKLRKEIKILKIAKQQLLQKYF